MRLFGFEISRKKRSFDNEQLEQAREIRELKAKLKKEELEREAELKAAEHKAQIEKLTQAVSKGNMEETLISIVAPLLIQKFTQNKNPTPEQAQQVEFNINKASDEEIKNILQKMPETYVKAIRKRTDEEIMIFLKKKQPTITEETVVRVLKIFRELYPQKEVEVNGINTSTVSSVADAGAES